MKYFVTLLLFACLATTGIAFAEHHEQPGGTEAPTDDKGVEVEAPDASQQPPSAGETDDMGKVEGEKPAE